MSSLALRVDGIVEPPHRRHHLLRVRSRGGTQESFGLSERKVKDQTDRQSRLERNVRVDALATGLAIGQGPPGADGVVRFGYFIGGDSGSGHDLNDAPKPRAMHQRRTLTQMQPRRKLIQVTPRRASGTA